MNHTYRVLTFLLCFMVSNLWGETSPLIEQDFFTTCADRTASNTTLCRDADIQYGGFLLIDGLDRYYDLENGQFQEFVDGTARFTGRWVNVSREDIQFDIDIEFAGRTFTPPNDPKEHNCLGANPANFYYYTQTSGRITGREAVAGAQIQVGRVGEAFQVGNGANVTNNELSFGGSGWLSLEVTRQPNTGFRIDIETNRVDGNGDININLSGDPFSCFGSEIMLDCPDDIITVGELGENGAVVTFNPPVATTTCLVGNNAVCAASSIRGFEFMGEFNGSRYFCSAENNHTWEQARILANAAGGHLAVICSQAENDFLQDGLLADFAWIGYTDGAAEGDFLWINGETCGYTNWNDGEPNNSGDGEDFARILKSSGKWTDRNENFRAEFIMEIPCSENTEGENVVITQLAGPASGSVFPIGMTEIIYEATDECGNTETCTFKVTVEEPVDPCAGDGSPMPAVELTDPDCGQNNGKILFTFGDNPNRTNIEFSLDGGQTFPLNVLDNTGMAMFSDLAPGTFNIAVRWGNGECMVDLGRITLDDSRQPAGTQCDDEDATTINDVIAVDGCACEGTPVGEIALVCEDDIAIIAEPGDEGVLVIFDQPTARTTCELDGLAIELIEGLPSGSLFPIGTTTVKYQVTDDCGNMEMCSFEVVIEETPLMFDLLCADDIEVTAEVGQNGVAVSFNEPSVISNCPSDDFRIVQIEGISSGNFFPIGITTVTYRVADECGQIAECSFEVTVNPAPTGDITFLCNNDIEVTETVGENDGVVVTFNDPTAETTCSLNGLTVVRTAGPASGSTFPIGTTTVTYTAIDACGEEETCSFEVTINPAPTGDITFVCNDDIEVTETVGEADGVVVTFNDPTATTTCSLNGLTVVRTGGSASGSIFPIGTTTVTYTVVDACGEEETCSFEVIVNPAPTGEIFLTCGEDQSITVAFDESTAVVNYEEPIALSTCELDGLNVRLVEGLPSGSEFPIGENIVIFEATDACGEVERCSLIIEVNPAPTGEIFLTCAEDQSITVAFDESSAVVNYDEPIALSTCELDGLNVRLVEGLPSGSEFPVGESVVVFEATDACGEIERCSLIITIIQLDEPTGSIGDRVFFDSNQNGIQDAEDTGVAGITVKLLNAANEILSTVETDDLGNYTFEEVAAGDYRVMVNLEDDFRFALTDQGDNEDLDSDILPDGMTELFTLAPGEDIDNIDAGLVRPIVVERVKVGDIVFRDDNGNGIRDNGEAGIRDVLVQLFNEDEEILQFTTTDENGMYMFRDLQPGNYQVRFIGLPSDLVPTIQDAGDDDTVDSDIDENGLTEVFTLVTGFDDTRDAGFKPRIVEPDPARVGNQVFLDANANGVRDNEEVGISGVEVKLIDANGEVVETTTTGNNGMYSFTVDAGSYQLMFGSPVGFLPTNQSGNATDGVDNDSDVNPTTGMTELFSVAAGETNSTIDAGFVTIPIPCDNVTDGGKIEADEDPEACGPFDAEIITNLELPTGGSGELEYIWLASTIECPTELTDMIPGANGPDYDPGVLTATTYFVRCARRVGCTVWIESDCVVKTVDACDNDGPVNCDAVTATVSEGKITVEGLIGINAKVEVIGAGTSWAPVLVCGDDGAACTNPQMITDLPAGDYTVKIQLWGADGSYCYGERRVTVDEGGTPACDVNGGTITTNDDITDLCVGDNEPSIVNFVAMGGNGSNRAWVVTDDNGMILNPDAPSSINFDPAGPGICYVYYLRYENITGLAAGANIDDLAGCFDLSNRIEVSRTEDCGDPACDVNGGTITTNDDITDLCVGDNEPSIVNFVAMGGNGSNRAWVVTDDNGMILNPDAPSSINFDPAGPGICYVYYLRYENITGLAAGANIDDLAGCFDLSNRIEVSRTEDCGGGEEPICDDVEVTTGNGKINLVGLSAPFVVVKIHDTNAGWAIIEQCINCEDPTTFNVPEGDYNVVIEFYRGFWTDKYCRRDVRVTVTGDNPSCTDNDGDGVCEEEDCDDNDRSIGARQAPGTSCDDGNELTVNDVILADGCSCAGEEETTPTPEREVCIEREVFNTDNCQFNIIYGLYLKLDGYDEYYEVSDAAFIEYTDGTALYTATAINNTSPNIGWNIEVAFGGRTTLAAVAPKEHNCLVADVNDYYFYESLTGTLTGINDAAGASMNITRIGPAFQLGLAANITHKFFDFGGSGWFVADMLTQPTNGLSLVLNEGAQGQNGDININLSGDGTECIEGRDNSELDCANVSAIATADGITISGLTAPIEIVKVFDASWVPIEDCTGDCGESMTVSVAPGNYVIRINFYTANWIGECEVDIPVTVPANLNSGAVSRNTRALTVNNEDLGELTVFPNPAKSEVFVNLKAYAGKNAQIQVVNTYGQIVKDLGIDEITTNAVRLDVNDVQTGLYHLRIQVENSDIITKKILINKQ